MLKNQCKLSVLPFRPGLFFGVKLCSKINRRCSIVLLLTFASHSVCCNVFFISSKQNLYLLRIFLEERKYILQHTKTFCKMLLQFYFPSHIPCTMPVISFTWSSVKLLTAFVSTNCTGFHNGGKLLSVMYCVTEPTRCTFLFYFW